MSLIAVTCATLMAALTPGANLSLQGDCGPIEIKQSNVSIEASNASVRGLRLIGNNIRWKGGRISAPKGEDGFATDGYGIYVTGTGNSVFSATITNAKKGMVVADAKRVTVGYNNFDALREDGIIASNTDGLAIYYNRFTRSHPRPTTCTVNGVVTTALAQRDCKGVWKDGDHADAIQMRDAVVNTTISYNFIVTQGQGIGQMDTTGDRPLRRVNINNNVIMTSQYHQITLAVCKECLISNNMVLHWPGDTRKAIIRPGEAKRCGNIVEDEKVQDLPC